MVTVWGHFAQTAVNYGELKPDIYEIVQYNFTIREKFAKMTLIFKKLQFLFNNKSLPEPEGRQLGEN